MSGSSLKIFGFITWLGLVSTVIFAIYNQEIFLKKEAESIASISTKSGDVLFRQEGLVRWLDAVERQQFHDGDWVATGPSTTAKLEFRSGQVLQLGPDTQIQIRSIIQGRNDYSFMITLSRGEIVAEVKKAPAGTEANKGKNHPGKSFFSSSHTPKNIGDSEVSTNQTSLIVRSGNSSVNVGSGNKIGLSKEQGATDIRKFVPLSTLDKSPIFNFKKSNARALAATFLPPSARIFPEKMGAVIVAKEESSEASTAHIAPSPVPPPLVIKRRSHPKPEIDTKVVLKPIGYEYKLIIPNQSVVLSTDWDISSLFLANIIVPIEMPKNFPKEGEIRPQVEISGGNVISIHKIEGQSPTDRSIKIPVGLIFRYGRVTTVGLVKEYEVSLRGGVVWKLKNKQGESFETSYSTIRIKSYGDLPRRTLTMGVERLAALDKGDSPWSPPKQDIPAETAPIQISLQYGADISKVMPFIRGSKAISLTEGGPRDESGIFVVRDQHIIAQLSGQGLTHEVLNLVLKTLSADFIFRGQRSSLHDSYNKSQSDMTSWVDELLDQGRVLYVMKRAKLYPVSREFVKTNNEVAKFIDSQARAVFVEKVDVLIFR
jgi:hypothetical protein